MKVPMPLLINNCGAKYVQELCGEGREGRRRRMQSLPVRGISLQRAHTFFLPCRFVFELALSSSRVSISASS